MNQFESIIKKERETSYSMSNKDMFTFYTLTLINQEESKRRHKRNLITCAIVVVALALVLFPFIEFFMNSYVNLLINSFVPLMYNPSVVSLCCFLVTGFVILNKKISN